MVNGFSCNCQLGFTGLRCEENINDCPSSGCGNGEELFYCFPDGSRIKITAKVTAEWQPFTVHFMLL